MRVFKTIFCLVLIFSIFTTVKAPEITGNFDFTVLKIRKADAIIMKTENHSILLDTGEDDDGKKLEVYQD